MISKLNGIFTATRKQLQSAGVKRSCASGWETFEGHCYLFVPDDHVSFATAQVNRYNILFQVVSKYGTQR